MNCCKCDKKVDITKNKVPPEWFGLYHGWVVARVICVDCIRKPENKDWWRW